MKIRIKYLKKERGVSFEEILDSKFIGAEANTDETDAACKVTPEALGRVFTAWRPTGDRKRDL